MIRRITALLLWTMVLAAPSLRADVLELKNGTILNGNYMGGTATTVRFDVTGNLQVVPTSDVVALTFTGPAPVADPPPAPAGGAGVAPTQPAPAETKPASPAPPPKSVTLPAGTSLLVRMKDGISSKNKAGTPFTTKLEYDLYVEKTKVLPAGTLIYGVVKSSTQARRVRGQSTLDLRLNKIVVAGGPIPVSSSAYAEAGEKAIKDAARGAAAGAAIGGIADGSDGAKKGAAIGAVAGALKRGESITISPGTLLEFKLAKALTVKTGG